MNEKRKQGILLLFPLVILLLGTGFTSVLFYHVYQQTAYEHISAFCEIILENTPEAEPQLLSALKDFHALTDQEVAENHHLEKYGYRADEFCNSKIERASASPIPIPFPTARLPR